MVPPRFIATCFFFLFLFAGAKHGWSQGGAVDPSFTVSTVTGSVYSLTPQSDGKTIVAGSFSKVAGVPRTHLARLNADGTVDTTFVPVMLDGAVRHVAVAADGKLLIAGYFNNVDFSPRPGLARLNGDGSHDATFNPDGTSDHSIEALVVQPDGRILVGGQFHRYAGDATRAHLVSLNADGSLDPSFDLGAGLDAAVVDIALQADGGIVIAGFFSTVNGIPRQAIARLEPSGALDTSFDAGTGPGWSAGGVLVQSDGKLIVQGYYSSKASGTARSHLYRLLPDGAFDASFDGGSLPYYGSTQVHLATSDRLVLSGQIWSGDEFPRTGIARLEANGVVDPLFDAGTIIPNSHSAAAAVDAEGRVIVATAAGSILRLFGAGDFPPAGGAPVLSSRSDGRGVRLTWTDTLREEGYKLERSPDGETGWMLVATISGERYRRIYDGALAAGTTYHYRLRAFNRFGDGPVSAPLAATTLASVWPGQIDLSFDPARARIAEIKTCLEQPDGKIIIAGGGLLVRLHRDGSLDRLYDASSPYNEIRTLLLLPDGRLIVGGRFAVAGGTTPRTLARFLPDGSEDTTFSANVRHSYFAGMVLSMVRQADGKLLIGGYFDTINGTPRGHFARLNADGSLDTAFGSGAGANSTVNALALGGDGRIAIVGQFSMVHGAARNAVARLLPDGSVDSSFTTIGTSNYGVNHVAVQADHRMLVAGSFPTLEGTKRPPVARLNEDGTIDPTFNFGAPYAEIRALVLPADGRSIIAGTFTLIGGIRRDGIARLTSNGDVDSTFDAVEKNYLTSLHVAPDSSLLAGGTFIFQDGTMQAGISRLTMSGGAPPPSSPSGLNLFSVNASQIRLTWTDVAGEFGYRIERSPNGTSEWTCVGQTAADATTHTDTGLAAGTRFHYRVRAFNGSGDSAPSDAASTYTMYLSRAPTNFAARGYGYAQAILTWNNAGFTDSFVIERSSDGANGWTLVGTVDAYATSWRDTGLTPGTSYSYRIRALNAGGDSVATVTSGIITGPLGTVPAGMLDPTFTPGMAVQNTTGAIYFAQVSVLLLQNDGKVIAVGNFGKYDDVPRKHIVRINPDGSLDPTFDAGAWSCHSVAAAVLQPDGKTLVAGAFTNLQGQAFRNVVRLNADGTVDPTFNATTAVQGTNFSNGVRSIALQADGKVLVGGSALIRLNADGNKDTGFTATLTGGSYGLSINAIAPLPGGKVLISGAFESVNGVSRRNLVRLNSTGVLDTAFNANLSSSTDPYYEGQVLVVQPDGKILRASGPYAFPRFARYHVEGAVDASFTAPSLSHASTVRAIALQTDGRMLIGGNFTSVAGVPRPSIARLHADGTHDASFDPGLGLSNASNALAVQPDGHILVGGYFDAVEGQSRNRIARLLGTSVTWDALQRWKLDHGLRPDLPEDLDLDSDGLTGLFEYALGGNPNVADAELLPVADITGTHFTLTYQRLRADVTYTVETSTDLENWSAVGVNQGTSGQSVTASVPRESRQFLRLRVSRP